MGERTYGGVRVEERRARRRAALVEAALDLHAELGWDKVTVRAVCARARLNDRYFHESFADRDELLLAARDGIAEEALAAFLHAIGTTAPEPEARIRAVVEAVVGYFAADERRGQIMFAAHEALRGRRREMVTTLARIVADQAQELLGDHAAPEPDRWLGALTLVNGTMEVFASWLRGELDVTREHLADFLVAMILTTGDLSTALHGQRR